MVMTGNSLVSNLNEAGSATMSAGSHMQDSGYPGNTVIPVPVVNYMMSGPSEADLFQA